MMKKAMLSVFMVVGLAGTQIHGWTQTFVNDTKYKAEVKTLYHLCDSNRFDLGAGRETEKYKANSSDTISKSRGGCQLDRIETTILVPNLQKKHELESDWVRVRVPTYEASNRYSDATYRLRPEQVEGETGPTSIRWVLSN